ncbi:RNA polymerase sigma factor [Actinomadura fibrosa]|uniref:RNA polymerase sigma factor n=1 Tax=Actinomadura fibrosa TaxID=111802 RepID=A0ABW2XQG0_9ACTN|nr:sigma-70 family RNA polymerase sigma factor [Actinomadura fibrosa]
MSGWPSLDRADDDRLARSLAAGDPGALIQVMDRYAARLYDYCHALLRDQEPAAGALHDALVAAYAHVTLLREPEGFRGWLYALVRNECLRRLRDPHRPAERHEAPEVEEGFLDEEERFRRLEARHLVHGALAGLRGRERESLDLMLRHGLEPVEIAGVLGMDERQAADLTGEALARLDDALAAAFVARTGRRDCPDLDALLGTLPGADGDQPLPPQAARRIVQHIGGCPVCHARRERISPARLLQVLPVAMMPTDLRGRVLATATDPALAADLAAVAQRAEPFDDWGWPVPVESAAPRSERRGAGAPRGLWAALAAAAAVVLIVTGAFFLMPSSGKERTGAQSGPVTSSSAPDPSESSESETPSDEPTPTESTPTPTPSTTTPTPSRTPTTRRPTRTPSRTVSSPPRAGTLAVGGCTISGPGPGSCSASVRAVGGPVTWSVRGTSGGVSAGGGGRLASGQSASVQVSGTCNPPGGSGTVSFSPGGVATITLSCQQPPDGGTSD